MFWGCVVSFLLATLLHNWHKPLYAQRGGKRAIKDQFSTVVSISISPKLKVPLTCPLLQDWGNDQAQKLRSMLGHLHALARKADAARWAERGCGCSVSQYIYLSSLGKMSNAISRNPKVHVLKTLYLKMVGKKEAHCIPKTATFIVP